MEKLSRGIIQLISRNSNWKSKSVSEELETKVYSQSTDWSKFINYLLIALGVSFTVCGIVFFFAFNWDDMPKFVKFGIVEGLIVACIIVILKSKLEITIKKIILTGATLLVGALFAVFGQVYQTGADAYSLFLIWTLLILIWTVVGQFALLWFVFMILLNTTIYLYSEQVAHWQFTTLSVIMFSVNGIFATITEFLAHKKQIKRPAWLLNLVVSTAIVFISIGIIYVIFGTLFDRQVILESIICLTVGLLGLAIGAFYGFRSHNLFYISAVGLSVLVIIACWLANALTDSLTLMFFIVGVYAVCATIGLVKVIIHLNREWNEVE